MDTSKQHEEHERVESQPATTQPLQLLQTSITLPARTLIVLCGMAGSGKSTFAQRLIEANKDQGFKQTMVVSSDHCRALVCDDETSQQVNRDTFDLFHYIIHKRMFQNRFTIADSTALQSEARHRLLGLTQRHHYYSCLFIFNIPPEICLQRDQGRHRAVGEQVIAYHSGLLEQAIRNAPAEDWDRIYLLEQQALDKVPNLRLTLEK